MTLPPIWVIRDPSPNTEYLQEVLYSLDGPGLLQHVASQGAAWTSDGRIVWASIPPKQLQTYNYDRRN